MGVGVGVGMGVGMGVGVGTDMGVNVGWGGVGVVGLMSSYPQPPRYEYIFHIK